jgi:hypothetical protein
MRSAAVATAALTLGLAAPAGAAVEALPAQTERLAATATTARCTETTRRGTDDTALRATRHLGLRARLAGARGDWDLLLLDGDGRRVGGSLSTGAREVVTARMAPGDALTVRACRLRGASRTARLVVERVALPKPAKAEVAKLLKVRIDDEHDGDRLAGLGLDLGEDGASGELSVVAYSAADVAKVASSGLPFRVAVPDLAARDRLERSLEQRAALDGSRVPSGRTEYRTHDAIQQELKDLAAAHPARTRLFDLDLPTSQGRAVPAIELADDPARAARDGRPTFVVVALHHAREWPATEMAMEFVHDTLGRGDDLLERSRIIVVPMQNPDGYIASREGFEVNPDDGGADGLALGLTNLAAYRRKTCSGPFPAAAPCDLQPGADSNRNYSGNWGATGASAIPYEATYRGDAPFSEPETKNIQLLLQRTNATMVLSIHNVLGAVLRPPGSSELPDPFDVEGLTALGQEVADLSGYINDTFHGGLGYDGSGVTEDWAYSTLGAYTYTIEVGPQGGQFHANYERAVEDQWDDGEGIGMRAAMRRLAEAAIDPRPHAVLTGTVPGRATLRASKAFTTTTGAPCTGTVPLVDTCIAPGAPQTLQDGVAFEIDATGRFEWHLPPSTRPTTSAAGGTEAYRLTCIVDGEERGTVEVVAPRGATTPVRPDCG